jgi:hypothetical protein
MGKINFGRVLLGGLLAGLVLNIGEVVFNDVIMGTAMRDWLREHNFAEPGGSFIAIAVTLTFVLGIVMVLLYALMRPRLGPGPKTAIVTALIFWFAICIYAGIINGTFVEIPPRALALAIGWCLMEYVLGALAGAWLYKDAVGYTKKGAFAGTTKKRAFGDTTKRA